MHGEEEGMVEEGMGAPAAGTAEEDGGWEAFYNRFKDDQRVRRELELDRGLREFLKSPEARDEDTAFRRLDEYSRARFGLDAERGDAWNADRKPFATASQYADALVGITRRGYEAVATDEWRAWTRASREERMRIAGVNPNKAAASDETPGAFATADAFAFQRVVPKTDAEIDAEIADYGARIEGQNFLGVMRAYDARFGFTPDERALVRAALRHGDGLPEEMAWDFERVLRADPERGRALKDLVDHTRRTEYRWWRDIAVDPFVGGFERIRRGLEDAFGEFAGPMALEAQMRALVGGSADSGRWWWNDAERAEYARLKDLYAADARVRAYAAADPKRLVDNMCARRLALEAVPAEERRRARRERVILEDALSHKPTVAYDYASRTLAGVLSTLPYMAVTAAPYAGFAANVLSQFETVRDGIILDGGDEDEAVGAQLLLAAGWAGIEKAQLGHLFGKPLTGLRRKAMLAKIYKASWEGGRLAKIGAYARQGAKEAVVATLAESMEEGLQGALEAGEMEWFAGRGGGHDGVATLAAALKGGAGDFVESLGTMGVLSLVGAGVKVGRVNRDARGADSLAEYAAAALRAKNVLRGTVMDPERPGADVPEAARRAVQEVWSIWRRHAEDGTGGVAALDEIRERYGLDEAQTRDVGDWLDLRDNLVEAARHADTDEEGRFVAGVAGGMFRIGAPGSHLDAQALYDVVLPGTKVEEVEIDDPSAAPAAPVAEAAPSAELAAAEEDVSAAQAEVDAATVGSARRGAERRLRKAKKRLEGIRAKAPAPEAAPKPTRKAQKVTLPTGESYILDIDASSPDIDSEGWAQSVEQAMREAFADPALGEDEKPSVDGRGLSLDAFRALPADRKADVAVTTEQYLSMTHAERESYCGNWDLGEGARTRILDETGRELLGADGVVTIKNGFRRFVHRGGNWELAHEHGHFIAAVASRHMTPGQIATMRRLFGDPTSENERWNEENANNQFAEWLRGKYDFRVFTPEERRARMNWFQRVLDTIKHLFWLSGERPPAAPVEVTQRGRALDAAFNALRSGDFSGLDVYAGIDFAEDHAGNDGKDAAPDARRPVSTASVEKAGNPAPEAGKSVQAASRPVSEAPAPKPAAKGAEKPLQRPESASAPTASADFQAGYDAAVAAMNANPGAFADGQSVRTGGKMTVFTPDYSMKVEAEPMWTPLASLVESTDDREVQMRDRTRAATDEQTHSKTRPGVFQPLALFPGSKSDDGAPIVGGGNRIISGHGRKRMLDILAQEGRFGEYLDAVAAEAARRGLTPPPDGMENPVLVLRVTGGLDRRADLVRFAELSNRWGGLERSGANPRLREEVEAALNTDRSKGEVVKGGRRIVFCESPRLFEAIGIPRGTVYTKAHTLRKIAKEHALTAGQIASAPELLERPAAVFDDNGEGYVFLTDATAPDEDGVNAPVMFYVRPDGQGNYVASAYARKEAAESKYVNLVNADKVMYIDKDKVARLPLRGEAQSSLITFSAGDDVKTPEDLSSLSSPSSIPHSAPDAQVGEEAHRLARHSVGRLYTGSAAEVSAQREYDEVVARYTNEDGTKKPGWMKAPNGKPTRLTERQWVQVRTPSFKKWFGDWERGAVADAILGDADIASDGALLKMEAKAQRAEAKRIYDALKAGGPVETADGRSVHFLTRGFKEIKSHSADPHTLAIVPILKEVVASARYIGEGDVAATAANKDVKAYHIYARRVNLGDGSMVARIVIREDKNGNQFYDEESTSIENVKEIQGQGSREPNTGSGPESPYAPHSLAEFFGGINPDSVSKVVDENGEPLVVYHGTNATEDAETWNARTRTYDTEHRKFTVFRRDAAGGRNAGHFFSDSADVAGSMGGELYAVHLAMRSPLVVDAQGRTWGAIPFEGGLKDANEVAAYAEAHGHDGLILRNVRDGAGIGEMEQSATDYVVFGSRQIKSATDNTGAFDPANPDIRFSVGRLYTGSAADYEKPSLHAVGTGEGSQVYGWGLYASDRRGVAEGYANSDAKRRASTPDEMWPKYKGKFDSELEHDPVRTFALKYVAREGSVDAAIQFLRTDDWTERAAPKAREAAEWLEKNRDDVTPPQTPSEHLYEQTWFTDRAPGDESHLLKWYDAISDSNWDRVIAQAEKEGLREKLKGAWWLRFNGDLEHFITDNGNSGDAIYERLSKLLGGPQSASEFLARAGIDGVKYPVDSYGKAVKDGDEAGWNYVSFRDDNIRVDHKWTDGEMRFSVRSLTDGRRYVSVTDVPSEFRAAKDIGEKRKIVVAYIRKRWKGKVIDEDGVRAFVNGSSAHEYTNPAKKTGEQVFSDKLDAASELEAIVATSTNPAIIPDGQDGHVHKGVKEWEHRDVMFSVDGRFYTGRVNIKVLDKTNAKGESQRLLHDVTGLKDITGEVSTLIDHSSKEASNSGEDVHIITNPRSKSQGASSESPLKPSSERSASADKPRSSATRRRSVGLANVATALFAQQMLAGKEVSERSAKSLLRNIGLGALPAPALLTRAKELAEANREKVQRLVRDNAPGLVAALAQSGLEAQFRDAIDGAVTGTAKAVDPSVGREVQRAVQRHKTRELMAARGFDAAQMMAELPIDLPRCILATADRVKTPEERAKLEEARKRREEERAAAEAEMTDEERLAAVDDPTYVPPSEESLALFRQLYDSAAAALEARQAEERRAAAEKAKRQAEGQQDGSGEADAAAGSVPSAQADADEFLPAETVQRIAPVFDSPELFAQFLVEWTAKHVVERHPNIRSKAKMWKNPVAIRELKQTATGILRKLARDCLGSPSLNYARNFVDHQINELESDAETRTYKSVLRKVAYVYDAIHENALRLKRRELVNRLVNGYRAKNPETGKTETVPGIRQLAGVKGRFSAVKEEFQRAIDARTEVWARQLVPLLTMGEERLASEIAEMERRLAADPTADDYVPMDDDARREMADRLALARKYGGLVRRMPGEIADAADEILSDLNGKRQAFEQRRLEREERCRAVVEPIVKAMEAGGNGFRGEKWAVTKWIESMQGDIALEMQNLVRFCPDHELRRAALEAIDEVRVWISEGESRYLTALHEAQTELNEGLAACYGSAEKGIRHLTGERIPEDVAVRIFNQGGRRPTYGQLLQLYASAIQSDYRENAEKHGRTAQLPLMEQTLTDADRAFHAFAVEWHRRNRRALSDAVEAVTGLPVTSPDALYCRVCVKGDPEGIPAHVVAWSPVPAALNRRVRHGKDFDESAEFFSVLSRQCEVRAQAVGLSMTGILLRDTIGSREVRLAAERHVGRDDIARVMDHVRDILVQDADGAADHSMDPVNVARKWAARFGISGNVSSALAQPASIPVWANVTLGGKHIGLANVARYMATVGTKEAQDAVDELVADMGFKARYEMGWSEEVANVIKHPSRNAALRFIEKGYDKGMVLSHWTDRLCSLWIAQGFYRDATRHFLERGEAPEEAKRKARAITIAAVEATQQSGRVSALNALQRKKGVGGSVARAFFQFKTAQVLSNNFIIQSVREVAARPTDRAAWGQLVRSLFIASSLVPAYMAAKGALWAWLMGDEPPEEDPEKWPEWFRELCFEMVSGVTAPVFFAQQVVETPLKNLLHLRTYGRDSGMPAIDGAMRFVKTLSDVVVDAFDVEDALHWDKVLADLDRLVRQAAAPYRHGKRAYDNRWGEGAR